MDIPFFMCVVGAIAAVPLHFLSVEHRKFQARYGKEQGAKISERYGRVSGYVLFVSLMGIWLSPQPRFRTPIFPKKAVTIPVRKCSIPLIHLIISLPLVGLGSWLLTTGVKGVSRRVSETHRPDKVMTTGVYAVVRHPQYLGWIATHLGFTFLFSAWYSLLFTPVVVGLLYLLARKEEEELTREFGEKYEAYKRKVRMFVPRWWK